MEYYLQALVPYPWQLQSYLLQYIVTILLFVRSILQEYYLPVPGCPAIKTALPAIFPSRIISKTTPAARRADNWPTMPCDI